MKPILFNTEMVQAILDGRKTSTRRVIKPQPAGAHTLMNISGGKAEFMCGRIGNGYCIDFAESRKLPYLPGDILYVRETFTVGKIAYGEEPDGTAMPYISQCTGENDIIPKEYALRNKIGTDDVIWKPSIFMPKESARIFLRVVRVQAERLQNITPEECTEEGAGVCNTTALFQAIWNNTIRNSDFDKYGWNANPWVWVINFERCERPSDA
jgi:hypothetical protein